jgi:hypothetical protein
LARHELTTYPDPITAKIRPQNKADEWALRQRYTRTVPKNVQLAEGMNGDTAAKPPILEWWQAGACSSYVLEQRGDVVGSVQIVHGERGYWLQLWADFYNPDSYVVHQLVRHALATIAQRSAYQPIYVGVCDYHGSLGTLLSDYGFAPITDRAKMVRPVMQWVRELKLEPSLILKPTAPVIGAPFTLPPPPETPLPPYQSRGPLFSVHPWIEQRGRIDQKGRIGQRDPRSNQANHQGNHHGRGVAVQSVGTLSTAQALAQATAQADVV